MTWKSTVVVSGLGLVATWLGIYTPLQIDRPAAVAARATAGPAPAPDIEQQANRLELRVRQETVYREPSRNPFRFSPRVVPPAPRSAAAPVTPVDPTPIAPPPAPPLRLAGIASDEVDGAARRTAILSTPGGVQFAAVGDEVAGYRVVAIDEETVELISTAEQTPLRLRLGN